MAIRAAASRPSFGHAAGREAAGLEADFGDAAGEEAAGRPWRGAVPRVQAQVPRAEAMSEGGMIRLESLIELEFVNSSFSSLSFY